MGSVDPGESFRSFEAAFHELRRNPITGDASLDSLLFTLPPETVQWIQDLSIPHWIDERIAEALRPPGAAQPTEAALSRLPFLREHPRGVSYHDAARQALRSWLLTANEPRFRDVCRRAAAALPEVQLHVIAERGEEPKDEETVWEHVYLRLGFDEDAGLALLRSEFERARQGRRLNACHQLVAIANEQWPLLAERTRDYILYFRGLLAFEERDFVAAEQQFVTALENGIPDDLRDSVELYQGRILEAGERWGAAVGHYHTAVARITKDRANTAIAARMYHRLATAELCLGDLKRAEKHVRQSLELNQAAGLSFGEALNLSLLGEIQRTLGDRARAAALFSDSLERLRGSDRTQEVATVLNNLAALQSETGDLDGAEQLYREVLDIRTNAGDQYGLGFVYSDLAKLYLRRNNLDAALRHYEASLKIFQQFRDRQKAAQVQRAMAAALRNAGKTEEAATLLREATAALPEDSEGRQDFLAELREYEDDLKRARGGWFSRQSHGLLAFLFLGGLILVAFLIYLGVLMNDVRTRLNDIEATAGGTRILREHETFPDGASAEHEVALQSGHLYRFVAICDMDCSDVDLLLHDPGGTAAARDVEPADQAMIDYLAPTAGTYLLTVEVAACDTEPCGYGVVGRDLGPQQR